MKIAVIGAGYVGLVTAACFSEFGYEVICIDNNESKIKKLKKYIIPIYEPGLDDLVKKNAKAKYLSFSNRIRKIKDVQIIFIAVGTPSSRRGDGGEGQHISRCVRQFFYFSFSSCGAQASKRGKDNKRQFFRQQYSTSSLVTRGT